MIYIARGPPPFPTGVYIMYVGGCSPLWCWLCGGGVQNACVKGSALHYVWKGPPFTMCVLPAPMPHLALRHDHPCAHARLGRHTVWQLLGSCRQRTPGARLVRCQLRLVIAWASIGPATVYVTPNGGTVGSQGAFKVIRDVILCVCDTGRWASIGLAAVYVIPNGRTFGLEGTFKVMRCVCVCVTAVYGTPND